MKSVAPHVDEILWMYFDKLQGLGLPPPAVTWSLVDGDNIPSITIGPGAEAVSRLAQRERRGPTLEVLERAHIQICSRGPISSATQQSEYQIELHLDQVLEDHRSLDDEMRPRLDTLRYELEHRGSHVRHSLVTAIEQDLVQDLVEGQARFPIPQPWSLAWHPAHVSYEDLIRQRVLDELGLHMWAFKQTPTRRPSWQRTDAEQKRYVDQNLVELMRWQRESGYDARFFPAPGHKGFYVM